MSVLRRERARLKLYVNLESSCSAQCNTFQSIINMALDVLSAESHSYGFDLDRFNNRPSVAASGIVDLKSAIKAGYLWKLSSTKSSYYVLTKSSLDHYKNRHCVCCYIVIIVDTIQRINAAYTGLAFTVIHDPSTC